MPAIRSGEHFVVASIPLTEEFGSSRDPMSGCFFPPVKQKERSGARRLFVLTKTAIPCPKATI